MEDTMSEDITEQAQETNAEQPSYDLTVQDLNAIKTIIDAAAQRGAFKPAEMEVVGKTYNKLVGFLTTIAKGGQNG
jgi:hypothetical protein